MAVLNWIMMFVLGVVTHGVHGIYFVLYKNPREFKSANADCWDKRNWGSRRLATWDNDDQWNRIVKLHEKAGSTRTWVGLTDADTWGGYYNEEGLWRFVDGGRCKGNCKNLAQWYPGEPNNVRVGDWWNGYKDEDCAEIRKSMGNKLNDARCTDRLWYVCEFSGQGKDSVEDTVPLLPQPDGPVAVPGSPSVFDFGVDPKGVAIVTLAAFNVIWTAIAVYYCSRCSQRDGVESYSKVVQFSENERVH